MVGGGKGDDFWLLRLVSHLEGYRHLAGFYLNNVGVVGACGVHLSAAAAHPLVGLVVGEGSIGAGGVDRTKTHLFTEVTRTPQTGYRTIASDIASQRRLRVTKGVYLPADIPMHGIFGSKDVIHSWAIPGLGVKIDCIPGYSSHRRLVFRWRGLYWGQCMEVCGRYHHWMPLLVRTVHKDTFVAWCQSYLHLSAASGAESVIASPLQVTRVV